MELEKLKKIIVEVLNVDQDEITEDTTFIDDLGADSLDVAEIAMALEQDLGLPELTEEDLSGITNVADLVRFVSKKIDD